MNSKLHSCAATQAVEDNAHLYTVGREEELIAELRSAFRNLPGAKDSTQCEKRWLGNVQRLIELVNSEDPRTFLQWDVIKRTMEVGNADFVRTELEFLRNGPDWPRWEQAIREVAAGGPSPSTVYPASSGNLIHYAYHIAQYENKTGIDITTHDCIFEFGGGYGGMYRLIHNLGFKGKYVIFDFPAFCALQQYFIKSTGLDVHEVDSFKAAGSGVVLVSDMQDLKMLLSQHVCADNGMFIASWSISEAPLGFRKSMLSLLSRFKGFLIAYQGRFEGNNNIEFFDQWRRSKKEVNWHNYRIEHIPNEFYQNNFYLIGQREIGRDSQ